MTTPSSQSVSLYYTGNGSDKEYHVDLLQIGDTWRVDIAYGRRGKPMQTGTKVEGVDFQKAKKAFDKIVSDKMKKGYTPAESGVAYEGTEKANRYMGVQPQLLTPLSAELLAEALADPAMIWQAKMDGERRLIMAENGEVTGLNRNGLSVALPTTLVDAVRALSIDGAIVIDSEAMGEDRIAPFDLIRCPEDPSGARPYRERLAHLHALLAAAPSPCFLQVPTAWSPVEAKALLEDVRERGGEGVTGKLASAPYKAGRHPDQVKFKFVESASLIVTRQNEGRRSVGLGFLNGEGSVVDAGNVTIPANHNVPPVGGVVEVEYLYAYDGGSLYQPVFKGPRHDRAPEDCTQDQLKLYTAQDYESYAKPDAGAPDMAPGM